MLGKPHILSLFLNSFNIFNKTRANSCKILYLMFLLVALAEQAGLSLI